MMLRWNKRQRRNKEPLRKVEASVLCRNVLILVCMLVLYTPWWNYKTLHSVSCPHIWSFQSLLRTKHNCSQIWFRASPPCIISEEYSCWLFQSLSFSHFLQGVSLLIVLEPFLIVISPKNITADCLEPLLSAFSPRNIPADWYRTSTFCIFSKEYPCWLFRASTLFSPRNILLIFTEFLLSAFSPRIILVNCFRASSFCIFSKEYPYWLFRSSYFCIFSKEYPCWLFERVSLYFIQGISLFIIP